MKPRNAGSAWPGPEYRIRVSFRAPIDFVFAWCTDYTPGDAALEKEAYERKIIERTSRSVVFEDLEESKDGLGLVEGGRVPAPAEPLAHGWHGEQSRRGGRLRPVQSPRRPNPTRPPMETEAPRAGCEAHEGGARSLLDAGMEEICLGPGGRLQTLSSQAGKAEDV